MSERFGSEARFTAGGGGSVARGVVAVACPVGRPW